MLFAFVLFGGILEIVVAMFYKSRSCQKLSILTTDAPQAFPVFLGIQKF